MHHKWCRRLWMERIVRRIRVRCTVEEEQREWEREKGEKEPERGGAPDSWSMSKKKEEERDIFYCNAFRLFGCEMDFPFNRMFVWLNCEERKKRTQHTTTNSYFNLSRTRDKLCDEWIGCFFFYYEQSLFACEVFMESYGAANASVEKEILDWMVI